MKLPRSSLRSLTGCLAILLLSGCNYLSSDQTSTSIPAEQTANEAMLIAELDTLLSSDQASFTAIIVATGQVLTANPAYFAASNKICRDVHLSKTERIAGSAYIACQQESGTWQLNRPLP